MTAKGAHCCFPTLLCLKLMRQSRLGTGGGLPPRPAGLVLWGGEPYGERGTDGKVLLMIPGEDLDPRSLSTFASPSYKAEKINNNVIEVNYTNPEYHCSLLTP